MTSVATFLSYNSTGLSDQKCDWLKNLSETSGATYVNIQEHFRKSKTIDKYFKEQFPKYNSYVIPGFREPGQTKGRPIAGIAQLSLSDIAIRKLCPDKIVMAQCILSM